MTLYPRKRNDAKSIGLEAEAAAAWKAVLESGTLTDEQRRAYQAWGSYTRHTVNMARIDRVVDTIRAPLAKGLDDPDFLRAASGSLAALSAPAINLAPVGEMEALVGPHHRIQTDLDRAKAYFLRDDTVVRIAPDGDVSIDFDGDVRTITLHTGFIYVARPDYAPGSLLVLPAIGGVVRVERGCALAVEIREGKACCQVVGGSCVITIDQDDFELGAGEGASFDSVVACSFEIDLRGGTSQIETRLAGRSRALGEVIQSLQQFSDVPITCASALASLQVAGSYQLPDTRAALTAIARELCARFEDSGETLHLSEDGC